MTYRTPEAEIRRVVATALRLIQVRQFPAMTLSFRNATFELARNVSAFELEDGGYTLDVLLPIDEYAVAGREQLECAEGLLASALGEVTRARGYTIREVRIAPALEEDPWSARRSMAASVRAVLSASSARMLPAPGHDGGHRAR